MVLINPEANMTVHPRGTAARVGELRGAITRKPPQYDVHDRRCIECGEEVVVLPHTSNGWVCKRCTDRWYR